MKPFKLHWVCRNWKDVVEFHENEATARAALDGFGPTPNVWGHVFLMSWEKNQYVIRDSRSGLPTKA